MYGPYSFVHGGFVNYHVGQAKPKQSDKDDTVAIVQTGELVVPRKYVKLVERFLMSKGVYRHGKFLDLGY